MDRWIAPRALAVSTDLVHQKMAPTNDVEMKGNDDNDGDDEEADEDYHPDEDPEKGNDDEDEDLPEDLEAPTETNLSFIQKQRVDDAFERIFGYKWGTEFHLPLVLSKRDRQLQQILGSRMAAALLRTGPAGRKRPRKVLKSHRTYKPVISSNINSTSGGGETGTTVPLPTNVPASGVDQVLQGLEAKQVTTVAKTHQDWDQFKDQTGLSEKLESQAESNSAYLKKQDFLTRVDERKFDLERQERERARLQRK